MQHVENMSELDELLERLQEPQKKKPIHRKNIIKNIIRRIWIGKYVAIFIIFLFLFIAWLAHFPLQKMNRFTTKIEVMFMKERDANKQGNVAYEIAGQITGWTTTTNKYDEMMVMRSKSVLIKMLTQTHLIDSIIKKNVSENGPFKTKEDSLLFLDTQINRYADAIDISYDKIDKLHRTSVVTLSMSGRDETVNRALVGLVKAYNQFSREYNEECYRHTLSFLENCIDSIYRELQKIDAEDEMFSESNQIINLDQQTNTYLDVDRTEEDAIKDMELQRRLLTIIRKYMNDMGSDYVVVPANTGIEDEQINRIVLQFNDLVMRRSNFLTSMGEDAMRVQTITNQIEDQRKAIIVSIDKLTEAFDIRMAKYNENKSASKERLLTMPRKQIIKDRLKRERAIVLPLYSLLQQKHTETLIARSAEQDQARIISPPIVIEEALTKNIKYLYVVALLLAFIVISIYLSRINLPVEKVSISDVLANANLPCWSILPTINNPVLYHPALEGLLTHIRKNKAHIIAITSGFSNEGSKELSEQLGSLLEEQNESVRNLSWNENQIPSLSKKMISLKNDNSYLIIDAGSYHDNPELPLISDQADITIYCLRYNFSELVSVDFANYVEEEKLISNGAIVVVDAEIDENLRINFATFDYVESNSSNVIQKYIKV